MVVACLRARDGLALHPRGQRARGDRAALARRLRPGRARSQHAGHRRDRGGGVRPRSGQAARAADPGRHHARRRGSREQALRAGASRFMTKPFTPEAILGEVDGPARAPTGRPDDAVGRRQGVPRRVSCRGEEHLPRRSPRSCRASTQRARGEPNPRAVRELFRALHTLKGLAAMVGVEPIVALAHAMETVLRVADRAGGRLPADALDPLILGREDARAAGARARGQSEPVAAPPERCSTRSKRSIAAPRRRRRRPRAALALDDPELAAKLSAAELTAARSRRWRAGESRVRVDFVALAGARRRGAQHHHGARAGRPARPRSSRSCRCPRRGARRAGRPRVRAARRSAARRRRRARRRGRRASRRRSPLLAAPAAETPSRAPSAVRTRRGARSGRQRRGVVRVDVERLDDAMEQLVGAGRHALRLVDAGRRRSPSAAPTCASCGRSLDENSRQLRDLRAAHPAAAHGAVAEVLERLPLLVRGLRSAHRQAGAAARSTSASRARQGGRRAAVPRARPPGPQRRRPRHRAPAERARRAASPRRARSASTASRASSTQLELERQRRRARHRRERGRARAPGASAGRRRGAARAPHAARAFDARRASAPPAAAGSAWTSCSAAVEAARRRARARQPPGRARRFACASR